MVARRTLIVPDLLAMREAKLRAARERAHGLQVLTFEHLAARMAGGFSRPVDLDSVKEILRDVLPSTSLGELDPIKTLPGMAAAAADTLWKVWRAGLDLNARGSGQDRIRSIAALEKAVVQRLPPSMKRPCDLVTAATARLRHAPAVLGPVEIVGHTEL